MSQQDLREQQEQIARYQITIHSSHGEDDTLNEISCAVYKGMQFFSLKDVRKLIDLPRIPTWMQQLAIKDKKSHVILQELTKLVDKKKQFITLGCLEKICQWEGINGRPEVVQVSKLVECALNVKINESEGVCDDVEEDDSNEERIRDSDSNNESACENSSRSEHANDDSVRDESDKDKSLNLNDTLQLIDYQYDSDEEYEKGFNEQHGIKSGDKVEVDDDPDYNELADALASIKQDNNVMRENDLRHDSPSSDASSCVNGSTIKYKNPWEEITALREKIIALHEKVKTQDQFITMLLNKL